jgi:hypothetical protein
LKRSIEEEEYCQKREQFQRKEIFHFRSNFGASTTGN